MVIAMSSLINKVQLPMVGMEDIAKKYNIDPQFENGNGAFQWKKRMGIHLAFHRNPVNIFIHALFSLVNAWAVLLIAYPFTLFDLSINGVPINFAMITLLLIWLIYIRMEFVCGSLTVFAYGLTYFLCEPTMLVLQGNAWLMVALGVFLTFLALAIQVFIGHNIAEDGIDDAMENFRELFETKNPLYISLLPFYTYLDLMFLMGYRKNLSKEIWVVTDELRKCVLIERGDLKEEQDLS